VVSALHEADYYVVNVDMTRAVAEAAQAVGARLVHVSSLAAAGPAPASAPRSELDPPRPITAYGRSKLEGERAVAGVAGLRWTVLRPGVVYGPGDRAMLPLFRLARFGYLPLIGRRSAAFTFINIADLVRAIDAAIETEADGEIIFAGHPQPVTTRDLLEAVRDAVGQPASIVPVPSAVTYAAAVAGDVAAALCRRSMPINRRRYQEVSAEGFVCRVHRLRDRLGVVAAVDLRSGLDLTGQWYRRQRWL
jgi:nucleoside-diphosphate-sugar epimerase